MLETRQRAQAHEGHNNITSRQFHRTHAEEGVLRFGSWEGEGGYASFTAKSTCMEYT